MGRRDWECRSAGGYPRVLTFLNSPISGFIGFSRFEFGVKNNQRTRHSSRSNTPVCAILDPMKGPNKVARCARWKAARAEQDRAFAAWLDENAERLGKLTRASRSAAKKEAWAALSPSGPSVPTARSEARKKAKEAKRAAWFAMRAEVEVEILREIRAGRLGRLG